MVSILGLGASEIGFRRSTEADVARLVHVALDHGVNLIDTAECYLESEALLGRVLQGKRQEVHLFTKCGHAAGLNSGDWERQTLEASIERSLTRLKTDYLDVIHLHSCSLEVLGQGDVVEVLTRAKAAGKTRYIGYSGDGEDALYALELGVFDSLETSVNVADQQAVELTIPRARASGVGVVAKRPIANAVWQILDRPKDSYVVPYWERLKILAYPQFVGANVQGGVETALKFTWTVPGVSSAIVGTTSPERLLRNIGVADLPKLAAESFETIRRRWREVAGSEQWVGLE